MENLEVGAALDEIFDLLRRSNKYIDETMPWVLAKDKSKLPRLETVIYNLLESIRVSAVLLKPFLPSTGDEILNQIGLEDYSASFNDNNIYKAKEAKPIFKRIDKTQV